MSPFFLNFRFFCVILNTESEVAFLNDKPQHVTDAETVQAIDENQKQERKIYWHPSHYNALQLELYSYHHQLTFEDEHYLSKEPLRMDVLIIKKESNMKIKKNIGRIFEKHNILEFKSETDSLTKWDYIKVMGYANLYAYFDKISPSDITVSFVSNRHPRNLFKFLKDERGLTVKEIQQGIYYVDGDVFKVQIIESKKLLEQENLFLKSVRSDLTPLNIKTLIEASVKHDDIDLVTAYLERIIEANAKVYEEAMNMMSTETYEIFDRISVKTGLKDKWKEEKDRENAMKMLQKGYQVHEIADIFEKPITWVEDLKKQLPIV